MPPTFEGCEMNDRVSDSIRTRAQKGHTVLLRSLASVSQKRAAELIGCSETTMNSIKADQLERIAALVSALGLKLVPVTDQTFDESYISALKTLAAIGLGSQQSQLNEGDE